MRQDGNGRGDVPVWSVAQEVGSNRSHTDRGTVVALGKSTVTIQWRDVDAPVVYPQDALGLRKLMPWE